MSSSPATPVLTRAGGFCTSERDRSKRRPSFCRRSGPATRAAPANLTRLRAYCLRAFRRRAGTRARERCKRALNFVGEGLQIKGAEHGGRRRVPCLTVAPPV